MRTPPSTPVWVGQSGLGMPNRDYYLNKGPKFDAYRAAYREYMTKLFTLIGDKSAAMSAEQGDRPREQDRRRRLAAPNASAASRKPTTRWIGAGLVKLVRAVDWNVVLTGVGLGDAQHFIVNETTAIRDGATTARH